MVSRSNDTPIQKPPIPFVFALEHAALNTVTLEQNMQQRHIEMMDSMQLVPVCMHARLVSQYDLTSNHALAATARQTRRRCSAAPHASSVPCLGFCNTGLFSCIIGVFTPGAGAAHQAATVLSHTHTVCLGECMMIHMCGMRGEGGGTPVRHSQKKHCCPEAGRAELPMHACPLPPILLYIYSYITIEHLPC